MNFLIVINYNSDHEVTNLISKSSFESLNIGKLIIHCNGDLCDVEQRRLWNELAIQRNINLIIEVAENFGYGIAINHWLEKKLDCDYVFFCNADLWIEENPKSNFPLESDVVGFGLRQNKQILLTKISYLTPLIPVRIRRILGLKNEYGRTNAIHGGFIGVCNKFVKRSNIRFNNFYFLYWDELWFCEDAISRHQANIRVSDRVFINHDGEKAGKTADIRYYMLRNGLHFYIYKKKCITCAITLAVLNLGLAILLGVRERSLQYWFFQGLRDFLRKKYGKRQ